MLLLALRAVVHADGTLKITVGITDPRKGVISWDESSSSFVTGHNTSERQRRGFRSLVIHVMVPPLGEEGMKSAGGSRRLGLRA